jgi:secernin
MCDTMVVIGPDFVGFAKNSDRDPNEAQRLDWLPAAEYPSSSAVRCTWLTIPQVQRTRAVLLSRPFWTWGAEMGTNDAGLVVGNEAVFTKSPFDQPGLTGMDLVRLALERAEGVDEAIQVISDLIRRHGQGGRCGYSNPSFRYHNSFLLADASKAAVLETAGRHVAVELVSPGVRAISNGLTLEQMQPYANRFKGAVAQCHGRRMRMESCGRHVLSPQGLAAALRDHGSQAHDIHAGRTDQPPRYRRLNGALSSPCVHYGGWLAGSQTVASWISILRQDEILHWVTGTSAPCLSLFRPVSVDRPRKTGAPEGFPDAESLWWRFETLHRRLIKDWKSSRPMRQARDEIEKQCFERPGDQDSHWAAADQWLTHWSRQFDHLEDRRPLWLQRLWQTVEQEAAEGNRIPARPA